MSRRAVQMAGGPPACGPPAGFVQGPRVGKAIHFPLPHLFPPKSHLVQAFGPSRLLPLPPRALVNEHDLHGSAHTASP